MCGGTSFISGFESSDLRDRIATNPETLTRPYEYFSRQAERGLCAFGP